MLSKIDSQEVPVLHIVTVDPTRAVVDEDGDRDREEASEIRRRMYERIARGNALAEAETIAHNKWK